MKNQFPAEQTDEIDAIISCFGEEFVSLDTSGNELAGTISVALEPRSHPIIISVDGKDYGRFETTQLSPVDLRFRLPADYPAQKPVVDVDCLWLPITMSPSVIGESTSLAVVEIMYLEEQRGIRTIENIARKRNTMLERLSVITDENVGFPMLYLCYENVKKFVDETAINELHLTGNNFAKQNGVAPMKLLEMVREECEKAEKFEFDAHCYDCEVCFENKVGAQCVRFYPCRHTFCKDCVTTYLKEKLTAQDVAPLTCLSDGCDSTVPQKLIVELSGKDAFDRYERILLSRVLDTMEDLAVCPRIACQKPATRSQTTENLATCLVCGHSFCLKCRRTFHGVQPCKKKFEISISALVDNGDGTWGLREVTLLEYLKATPEDRIEMGWWYGGIENLEAEMEEAMRKVDGHSYMWIEENSKKCPKCSIPIQKTEGCNKMVCAYCNTFFCYRCEEVINKKDPYKHFQYGNCEGQLFDYDGGD